MQTQSVGDKTGLVLTCERGLYTIELPGGWMLKALGLAITTEERQLYSTDRDCVSSVEGARVTFRFPELTAQIDVLEVGERRFIYDCAVTNTSPSPLRIRSITPVDHTPAVYMGGPNPFLVSKETKVMVYPAERCYGYEGPVTLEGSQPSSSVWFISVHDPESSFNLLAGICDVPQGLVRYKTIVLHAFMEPGHRLLRWACEVDCLTGMRGVRLEPGATLRTGAQYIATWEGRHQDGLEAYGERLARRFHKSPRPRVPSGWCSWYAGDYDKTSEAKVLRNLAPASELPGAEYFQLDYCWETAVGTKTAGEPQVDAVKFPRGMKALADDIRSRGLAPGIWIRPFLGWGEGSDVPSWARGRCMDVSHPEARQWLRNLARTLVEKWGYEYLKLDFITQDWLGQNGFEMQYAGTHPVRPFDDSLTNVQAFRMALEAIREGAGEKCFLLGCNCLHGPAFGLVDGNRMGDDVWTANWDRTFTMGVKCTGRMYFLNNKVCANDPDCLLFHEPMSLDHARMWATLVSLAGQMALVSSPLPDLPPERQQTMLKVLPVVDTGARPLDIFSDPPEIWNSQIAAGWDDYVVAGVFNWTAQPRSHRLQLAEAGLPPGEYLAYEFWGEQYLGSLSDVLEVSLPGEGCMMIALRRRTGRPQLVGTTRHILQGKVEIGGVDWHEAACELRVRVQDPQPFDLMIFVPKDYAPKEGRIEQTVAEGALVRVPVLLSQAQEVVIPFAHASAAGG